MAGGNANGLPARPYYFRRCKRPPKTNIGSLPDDLLFNILLRLTAEYLYDVAMLVCRKWYNIIHSSTFVDAHYQSSTSGLLSYTFIGYAPIFVGMREGGRIETSKLYYRFRVVSNWNGLILLHYCGRNEEMGGTYIANPATKQYLIIQKPSPDTLIYTNIVYAAAHKQYKVLGIHQRGNDEATRGCSILTVGVDECTRHVDIGHLSRGAQRDMLHSPAFITQGFLHWAERRGPRVVTYNAETETVAEIALPQGYEDELKYFVPSEKCLWFFVSRTRYLWEVWEMKSETGEWTKLPHIDLKVHKRKILKYVHSHGNYRRCYPKPVGWLKDGELLVLRFCDAFEVCFAYDVRKQEINTFEIPTGCYVLTPFRVHRNCLVPFPAMQASHDLNK